MKDEHSTKKLNGDRLEALEVCQICWKYLKFKLATGEPTTVW